MKERRTTLPDETIPVNTKVENPVSCIIGSMELSKVRAPFLVLLKYDFDMIRRGGDFTLSNFNC